MTGLYTLADFLGIQPKNLAYIIYRVPEENRYHSFDIPKKNGSKRHIDSPNIKLKSIQRTLAKGLIDVYPGKFCVHGYVKEKSILTNALSHAHHRWVVNIDLQDFFPSIHFGRVYGLFKAKPFEFNEKLSKELANLCCYQNHLPQGAPTSPIISNFICWKLDNELYSFAKKSKCTYSRYADDITFSGNVKVIPEDIGSFDGQEFKLSDKLNSIIEENGFKVNINKCRCAWSNNHQEVTGLTVNNTRPNVRRTYIRRIRAMLHASERYGLASAAAEHFNKYSSFKDMPKDRTSAFVHELTGKIGFVRFIKKESHGVTLYDSKIYAKLKNRLKALSPEIKFAPTRLYISESNLPVIMGEGKTDWKYLKWALDCFNEKGEFKDIRVNFREYGRTEAVGYKNLLAFCERASLLSRENRVICVFDRDCEEILLKAQKGGKPYRYWGGNVYSLIIPKPVFRQFDEICIEQYFTDDEIKTTDENGRRLFISKEFDNATGVHCDNPKLIYGKKNGLGYLKSKYPRIIAEDVWTDTGVNVALPKRDFAEYIYEGVNGFNTFSHESFRPIFELMRELLEIQN